MRIKNENGFSLVELLAVVVIIGILATFAVIGYQAVLRGTKNSLQTVRLMKVADAQGKYRTVMGKRRYATLKQLIDERLLPDETVNAALNQATTARDGWYLRSNNEAADYLRSAFDVELLNEQTGSYWRFCITEDGVLRRATAVGESCTRNSPSYNP